MNLICCDFKIFVFRFREDTGLKLSFFVNSFFRFLIRVCWPQIKLGSVSSVSVLWKDLCKMVFPSLIVWKNSRSRPQGTVVYFEGRFFLTDSITLIDIGYSNFIIPSRIRFGKLCFSRNVFISLKFCPNFWPAVVYKFPSIYF